MEEVGFLENKFFGCDGPGIEVEKRTDKKKCGVQYKVKVDR